MITADIQTPRQPIEFTEVTLRDGEQQQKRYEVMPVEDRQEVFDNLVLSGMRRIEIGHLGNPHDVAFAKALVEHITETEQHDDRYKDTELQVLFGTHEDRIEPGLAALEGFDKDRVVVHAYDRVSFELRSLATEPKSVDQSASDVVKTCQKAIDLGFTRVSVSGEGAVNNTNHPSDVFHYYSTIVREVAASGATEININLANTFGLSPTGQWDEAMLRRFNRVIKAVDTEAAITTSVHAHNDMNSAVEFSMAAVRAGFDRIEGTMTGMGERAGNTAFLDVMARYIEEARALEDTKAQIIGGLAVKQTDFWNKRNIPAEIVQSLPNWHYYTKRLSEIYGTMDRFERTSLGNPYAYDAGSGPHAYANKRALEDPVNHPLWRNYCTAAIPHAMLGRPEAQQILAVDPKRLKRMTLQTHAAGGSNKAIHEDEIVVAPESERKKAKAEAYKLIRRIGQTMCQTETEKQQHHAKHQLATS